MTGPAVLPGGEELREVAARALYSADDAPFRIAAGPNPRPRYLCLADAVLALPAVRDALAAQEKVRRVRERIDAIDADDEPLNIITTAAVRQLLGEST